MKRRLLSWLILLIMLVNFAPQAFAAEDPNTAKTKTVWVIVSKTNNEGTENELTSTYTYNSKGLVGTMTSGYGFTTTYTYNKKNLLTEDVTTDSAGTVTATKKYYYSKRRAKKTITEWPDSTEKQIQLYTWKKGGKKLIMREGFGTDDSDANDLATYTLGDDKRYLKVVVKNDISDFTYWYKYDKKGRRVKAYLLDHIYGPTKKTLSMTYKFKANKKGCIVKDIMTLQPSGNKIVTSFKYKKIKVPASAYKLVMLQQRWIHGWTPEYLELLTD